MSSCVDLPAENDQAVGTNDPAPWAAQKAAPTPLRLETAILHTMAYADLFDYPLTAAEIHRYLIGHATSPNAVTERLGNGAPLCSKLESIPPFWFLAGRQHLVKVRQERESFAKTLWPAAWRYGRAIAALPFIRMVAISGSLAMNNVSSRQDDIDLMIVARPGRVWFARGLAILVVRLARVRGVDLCPNYIIAENRLELSDVSLFTAHELAQMVPLYGSSVYRRLLDSNPWIDGYLPNALSTPSPCRALGRAGRGTQRILENVFGGRLGNRLEEWERARKVASLEREAAARGSTGACFDADLCKGHMADHAAQVQADLNQRLTALST